MCVKSCDLPSGCRGGRHLGPHRTAGCRLRRKRSYNKPTVGRRLVDTVARTLDPVAHAVRRDAFIDAAQRLIQTKGYEQMSIQDVLDEIDASRGAFYHYFDSKAALLDAVIERMVDDRHRRGRPIVDDPDLSAVEKLDGLFSGIARWKASARDLMLAVLEVWISDDNAIVREKFRQAWWRRLTPLLAAIVASGRRRGHLRRRRRPPRRPRPRRAHPGRQRGATELFFARQAGADPVRRGRAGPRRLPRSLRADPRARPGSLRWPSTRPPSTSGSTDAPTERSAMTADHRDREAHQVLRFAPRDHRRRPRGRRG